MTHIPGKLKNSKDISSQIITLYDTIYFLILVQDVFVLKIVIYHETITKTKWLINYIIVK